MDEVLDPDIEARIIKKGEVVAVSFDLINKRDLDNDIGIERVRVSDLLQTHSFEEITLYTPSDPCMFKGIIQPDEIIVLVDGVQVQSLDEFVGIREAPCVEVVRVVQL